MLSVINRETRVKVVYKTVEGNVVIVSPISSDIDSKTLEIALNVLSGKINIDALLTESMDVIDDDESYIEAPEKFWTLLNSVKQIVTDTENTYYHQHGASVYAKNIVIVRRKQ
ncbi:hypothetical protein ELBI_103 [Anabaena phage Elbi]|nr:hypothetical protein ELBI_103 [Anabaena phage Elbi]